MDDSTSTVRPAKTWRKRRTVRLFLAVVSAVALAAGTIGGISIAQAETTAADAPAWPLVREGQNGTQVKTVQHLLRHHGHDIEADGAFGPLTKGAAEAFQSANGLGVDGIVGSQTWPVLTVALDDGATGEAVHALQTQLNRHGAGLSVDGQFGPATGAAVTAFKADHGIGEGTAVDTTTWQYLIGAAPPAGNHSLPLPRDAQPRDEYDDPHHDYPAIDLAVPTGTPALAVTAGTATLVNDSSCGIGVIITDGAGNRFIYCHFSAHGVGNGAAVAAGEQIGLTGNTGNSTGPHLHFAIKVPPSNTSVCPQTYLLAIYDGAAVPDPASLPTTGCYY